MYLVFIIEPSGKVTQTEQPKAPNLEQLQKAVDGYIETIPNFTKYMHYKRGRAFCNENGLVENRAFNPVATKAWEENLKSKRLWYKPAIYGTVIYYVKA